MTSPNGDELKRVFSGLPAEERLARDEGTYFANIEDIWERESTTNIGANDPDWFQAIVGTPEQERVL